MRIVKAITSILILLMLISSSLYIFTNARSMETEMIIDNISDTDESTILTAERINEEILIDGLTSEDPWQKTRKLIITIQDGSIGQIDVELKALYDDDYIYLFVSWPDPSESIYRNQWVYDASSDTWMPQEDEDRIAILWNIENSIRGFNIGGCAMTCHGDRKSTNADGEIGDMWQWGAALTNPVGFTEDTYLDNVYNPSIPGGLALHRDSSESGGPTRNYNNILHTPSFMQDPGITPAIGNSFLTLGDEIEFNTTYSDPLNQIPWSNGDTIPGYILEKPEGSRGDIFSKGIWSNGRWDVEFKRELVTGNEDDVEFDVSNIYRFGIAVMDNSGGFRRFGEGHSFDLGARTLEFGGEGSEVITSLSLIRDYLMVAKGYLYDENSALAKSEINNAFAIFEGIENDVVEKDPQRYLETKNAFEQARSHTTIDEIDTLIGEVDDLILLFQGKIKPTTPSFEARFMAFWTQSEAYVFILLSILAFYLLYLISRTIRRKEWRWMSIFLLIISIPIFLEGVGRFGVLTNISVFYSLSFMTNEYAKLMWGILMFCAIVFSTLGFRDLDNNIKMLKKSEEEIKYLNAFNENVLRTVPIGIMVVDPRGRTTFVNPMFSKIRDLFKKENEFFDLSKSGKLKKKSILYKKYHRAATFGESFEIQRHPLKFGKNQNIYLNVKGGPLRNPDGEIEGVIILFEDTTGKIKLEERLLHTEKLASIGQLAAGVAHELNTPLMNISLITENINTLTADEHVLDNVNSISNQVYGAAKIVDDLLLFSRKKKAEFVSIDINEILLNAIKQVHESVSGTVKLIKKLDDKLPLVEGDSVLLERVFINIIDNAIDAMHDGGTLTLETGANENEIEIQIKDTGLGISKENLKEIFNPFYTTKAPNKGTGLGLSICHGIIQEFNGTIDVKSIEGQGTTFIIKLPK